MIPWQRGWVVSLEAREREVADGWSFYIFICCKILNISFLIFKPGVCEKNRLRRDHRGAERARLGYRAINAMGGFGGRARTVHSQKDTVRLWLLCQQSFSDGIYKKSKIVFFFFFSCNFVKDFNRELDPVKQINCLQWDVLDVHDTVIWCYIYDKIITLK